MNLCFRTGIWRVGVQALVILAILGLQSSGEPGAYASPKSVWDRLTVHEVPRPVPETPFANAAGEKRSLGGFRGKFLLVNFWATWCLPCIVEMPSLDRLAERLGETEFAVLPIAQDRRGIDAVAPFYARLGLAHLPVYLDRRSRLANELEIRLLPTTLFVDRRGREVARMIGDVEWDTPEALAFIQRFMGERE